MHMQQLTRGFSTQAMPIASSAYSNNEGAGHFTTSKTVRWLHNGLTVIENDFFLSTEIKKKVQ